MALRPDTSQVQQAASLPRLDSEVRKLQAQVNQLRQSASVPPSGSNGGLYGNAETFSTTGSIASDTSIALCDTSSGGFTVTLPAPSLNQILHVKNTGTNVLTIATPGSETIDGSATISLTTQYESVMLHFDGTNWHII